jgi:hypothetical protein
LEVPLVQVRAVWPSESQILHFWGARSFFLEPPSIFASSASIASRLVINSLRTGRVMLFRAGAQIGGVSMPRQKLIPKPPYLHVPPERLGLNLLSPGSSIKLMKA